MQTRAVFLPVFCRLPAFSSIIGSNSRHKHEVTPSLFSAPSHMLFSNSAELPKFSHLRPQEEKKPISFSKAVMKFVLFCAIGLATQFVHAGVLLPRDLYPLPCYYKYARTVRILYDFPGSIFNTDSMKSRVEVSSPISVEPALLPARMETKASPAKRRSGVVSARSFPTLSPVLTNIFAIFMFFPLPFSHLEQSPFTDLKPLRKKSKDVATDQCCPDKDREKAIDLEPHSLAAHTSKHAGSPRHTPPAHGAPTPV